MSVKILYEDDSVIIIEKPAGVATQTSNVTLPDCVSMIREHIKRNDPSCGSDPYIGIIHRLDQPVAGILVFAKNKNAAASLSRQVSNGQMNKHYRAVVEGIVDEKEDRILENQIRKDARNSRAVIVDDNVSGDADKAVQKAVLMYHTEKILRDKNMSIMSVKLITGRFHQIRAQFSHMNHPIVGDRKYGASTSYPTGIALVADRLEFIHPDTGEKVEKVVDFSFAL